MVVTWTSVFVSLQTEYSFKQQINLYFNFEKNETFWGFVGFVAWIYDMILFALGSVRNVYLIARKGENVNLIAMVVMDGKLYLQFYESFWTNYHERIWKKFFPKYKIIIILSSLWMFLYIMLFS